PRPVRFFYGARSSRDLFHLDELSAIGARLADFQVITALSEAAGSEADGYETGLVTDVVRRRLGREIADHEAYLCGPPPMIDATLVLLEAHGLRERKTIFYDKFSPS
ncbi:MAG TPA: CDP-6-deoxy-delta-3,4-glucoseen reductase, partial [Acidimicrobiia bacterium]